MSRSYKKHLAISGTVYKEGKRAANRRVRRLLKNPSIEMPHRSFKKFYPMWDVRDYREVACSFEQFYQYRLDWWAHTKWRGNTAHMGSPPPSREQAWRDYQRCYKRK